MKKTLSIIFVFVMLLTLGLSTMAAAQGDNPDPFAPYDGGPVPLSISTFTIDPSSAAIGDTVTFEGDYTVTTPGTTQIAICFYFTTADASSWSTNFTTLGSVAGVPFTKYSSSPCPGVGGYSDFGFYATDTSNAGFGDMFEEDVVVPNIATGTKLVGVKYYEGTDCDGSGGTNDIPGGTNCNTNSNQDSTNLTVNPAPTNTPVPTATPQPSTVYTAANASACSAYDPCYTTLASAYAAVAAGGTIHVNDDMPAEDLTISKNLTIDSQNGGSITGAGTAAATLILNGGTVLVQDLEINAGTSANVIGVTGSTATLKGNDLSGGTNAAITQSAGSVVAYANNITGYATPALVGTFSNARHNWWGGAATSAADIHGSDTDPWDYRLGSDVASWGEDSLGNASVSGGNGTGVIVSHGRGSSNAPFGKATVADGNTQCTDYYDVFIAPGGSGIWDVDIPIDSGSGCDTTYNNRQLFLFQVDGTGKPDDTCTTVDCWDDLEGNLAESVVQLGRSVGLRWTGVTTAQLGGSPIVGGNQDGNDPTIVQLQNLTVTSARNTWIPIALAITSLTVISGLFLSRRRKNNS